MSSNGLAVEVYSSLNQDSSETVTVCSRRSVTEYNAVRDVVSDKVA